MPMRNDTVVTIRRTDYRPPAFLLERVVLEFDSIPRRPASPRPSKSVAIPPCPATPARWSSTARTSNWKPWRSTATPWRARATNWRMARWHIPAPSDRFTVRTVSRIRPDANTELMGLFVSNGNFFSQCEAEGFRRITYFPDRPT